MKVLKIGIYAVAMLGLAALPAVLSAGQDQMTAKQMEDLVAKASTPADHTQLSKHFLEMAAKYKADAETHGGMAARYRRNPGPPRRTGGDPAIHCDLIARRAREAATSATELAKHHEHMAAGAPKTDSMAPMTHGAMPMAEPRFPDLLVAAKVQELIATAKTSADHMQLGKHFAAEAARYTADANRHAAMAAGYRGANQRGNLEAAASHCDRLVQQIRDAATAARELGKYHEGLAAETTK